MLWMEISRGDRYSVQGYNLGGRYPGEGDTLWMEIPCERDTLGREIPWRREGDTLWREVPWGRIYSEEGDILGREIYLTQEYYHGFIYDREKYAGVFEKPPHYSGHEFTCDRPLRIFWMTKNY